MKKIEFCFPIYEYDSFEELPREDQELLSRAREALSNAYAPYSQYYVGAAVRLANGMIILGNNQENAAYPSGLCAERVAVYAAAANYPDVPVTALALTAKAKNFRIEKPVTPCGSCRQALSEYENLHHQKIRTIMMGETGKINVVESIGDILPVMFIAEELKKNKR